MLATDAPARVPSHLHISTDAQSDQYLLMGHLSQWFCSSNQVGVVPLRSVTECSCCSWKRFKQASQDECASKPGCPGVMHASTGPEEACSKPFCTHPQAASSHLPAAWDAQAGSNIGQHHMPGSKSKVHSGQDQRHKACNQGQRGSVAILAALRALRGSFIPSAYNVLLNKWHIWPLKALANCLDFIRPARTTEATSSLQNLVKISIRTN